MQRSEPDHRTTPPSNWTAVPRGRLDPETTSEMRSRVGGRASNADAWSLAEGTKDSHTGTLPPGGDVAKARSISLRCPDNPGDD